MVIQRNWKHNDYTIVNVQQSSTSSEDSNGSNHTISSSNTASSKGPSKFVTTPQMAENVLSRLKQRFGTGVMMQQKSSHESEAVMRSLELLRINIQSAFDKEIDVIVRKFIETYFRPAFKNIKENLGEHVVSDDILVKMSCALIENSKSQYNTRNLVLQTQQPVQQQIQSSYTPQQTQKKFLIVTTSVPDAEHILKPTTTITTPSHNIKPEISTQTVTNTVIPALPSAIGILKRPAVIENKTIVPPKKPMVVQQRIVATGDTTTTLNASTNPSNKNNINSSVISSQIVTTQPRRQIFWNTANISTETLFVLDVQANQSFGFGTDGRERLASKHPELIRYLPDLQDRDWLVQEKIIPVQNRNSRFLFLVYDEVMKLGQSEMYRSKDNLNLQLLTAFKIPSFIIQKMKMFFIDLNIKSRGLITNSFSSTLINSTPANSFTNNISPTTGNTMIITSANTNNNGSQLRTALLQGRNGNTNILPVIVTSSATSMASPSTQSVTNIRGTHLQQSQTQQKIVATSVTLVKPRSSLSSSHATLTALLTNNPTNIQSSENKNN